MFRTLCAHHQEVKIVLYSIWYHHTCRWPSRAQVDRGLSQPVSPLSTRAPDGQLQVWWYQMLYNFWEKTLNLCTGRPPTGVMIPDAVQFLREDSQPVHRTATYRCDDTRRCIIFERRLSTRAPDGHLQVWWYQTLYNFWEKTLNLCTGRLPTGVMIPDAV